MSLATMGRTCLRVKNKRRTIGSVYPRIVSISRPKDRSMMKMSLEEDISREDLIYRLVSNQQDRIKELVSRVKDKEEDERVGDIRLEILKQKIVYRLIWEEIERIYFYSKKFQREFSVEEMRERKILSVKDLDDFLSDYGYVYNVYYIERDKDIKKKVDKVNGNEDLVLLKMLKKSLKCGE